jgi:hypothetical protein
LGKKRYVHDVKSGDALLLNSNVVAAALSFDKLSKYAVTAFNTLLTARMGASLAMMNYDSVETYAQHNF